MDRLEEFAGLLISAHGSKWSMDGMTRKPGTLASSQQKKLLVAGKTLQTAKNGSSDVDPCFHCRKKPKCCRACPQSDSLDLAWQCSACSLLMLSSVDSWLVGCCSAGQLLLLAWILVNVWYRRVPSSTNVRGLVCPLDKEAIATLRGSWQNSRDPLYPAGKISQ